MRPSWGGSYVCAATAGVVAVLLISVCLAIAAPIDYTIAPEILSSTPFQQIVRADFDGDGLEDLATGGIQTRDTRLHAWVAVYRQQAPLVYGAELRFETGSISTSSYGSATCRVLAVADLNQDLRPDLVVSNDYSYREDQWSTLAILLGVPGLGFTPFVESPVVTGDLAQAAEVADFDADGSPDLLLSSGGGVGGVAPQCTLFWNAGDGTFTAGPTYAGGGTLAVGDFNHDSKLDFACGRPTKWFQNLGGRAFGIPTPLGSTGAIVARDLNNDARTDLVVAGSTTDVFLQLAGGGFAAVVSYPYSSTASALCADLDGNAAPDLVVAGPTRCVILQNDGAGAFAPQIIAVDGDWQQILCGDVAGDSSIEVILRGTRSFTLLAPAGPGAPYDRVGNFAPRLSPLSAAVADLDADGKADLLAGRDGIAILRGRADGTLFARRDLDNGLHGVVTDGFGIERTAIADFDGDGHTDLLLQQWSGVSILRGVAGPALFAAPVVYGSENFIYGPPADLSLGDVDGDGDPDLIMAVSHNEVRVVPTVGGLLDFRNARHLLAGAAPTSVAAADLDGDGQYDDVAANGWDHFVLLLQSLGAAGFAAPVYVDAGTAPQFVRAADLDGDSRPDLIVGRALDVAVLWNLGAAGFSAPAPVSSQPAARIATGDVTGDGAPEIFAANGVSLQILVNAGGRSFVRGQEFAFAGVISGIGIGDVDGDQRADVVVPCHATTVPVRTLNVLHNEGVGAFTVRDDITVDYGGDPAILTDLDGDSRADIVLGTSLFTNNIDPVSPITVDDFTARVNRETVRLEWRLSRDAAALLRGLRVERSAAAAGPFELLTATPLPPAPVMDFTDIHAGPPGTQQWYRLGLILPSGAETRTGALAVTMGSEASSGSTLWSARQVAPEQIEIHFTLAAPAGTARLVLFDVRGHVIRGQDILDAAPGEHLLTWDTGGAGGTGLARMVYFVRLECHGRVASTKLVVAR